MRQRTRELAKPGIYGTEDNPQIVTEQDLREIAETFPEVQRAPVSLNGHWPDPSRPRMGNVISVTYDEATQTLIGVIEEQDELADAVDKGYFPDVSIGAKRRAKDGKMYLHHVAYLGEEPPAIKDLVSNLQNTLSPKPEGVAASDAADVILFPSAKSTRLQLSDHPAVAGKSKTQGGISMTVEDALSNLEAERKKVSALSAEVTQLKGKLEELGKRFPEAYLSDSDPKTHQIVQQLRASKRKEIERAAEGKVPKAKQGVLGVIVDHLSLGQIELSEAEGKRQATVIDLLREVLESIPLPVPEGKMHLSDPAEGGKPLEWGKLLKHV